MEKNNSNNILTIILIILVICLSAFIGYDKLIASNNNEEIVNNNENENINNTNIENDKNNENFITIFAGKYEDENITDVEDQINEDRCKSYVNFELNEDGTYSYEGGESCGNVQTITGNYSIGKDKIYLFNDKCKVINIGDSCDYPNCSPIYEFNYNITNNEIEIYTTNNTKLEKK